MSENNKIKNEPLEAKQLARSLLAQGLPVEDVMAQTTLTKPVILGLKGSLIKAQKRLVQASKPAYKQANPTEAISKPQLKIQAENEADIYPEGEGDLDSSISSLPSKPHNTHMPDAIPQNLDLGPLSNEPPEMMSDLELNIEEKRLKREMNIKRLRAKNAWLDHVTRHPDSYYSGSNGHNGHESQPIMELKAEVRELRQNQQNKSDPAQLTKMVFDAYKTGVEHASPRGQGDPTDLMWKAVETVEKIQERASNPSPKNEFDLKVEALKSDRDIDNRKIDFEEKKWEYQQQHSGDTLNAAKDIIKEVTSGPIGEMIKTYGSAKAENVRNSRDPRVPMVDVQCPSCQARFKANTQLARLQCSSCGAILEKQQPTEPQEQPQPEQPQEAEAQVETPKPMEEPQREKPKVIDITSELGEKPRRTSRTEVTNIQDLNKIPRTEVKK